MTSYTKYITKPPPSSDADASSDSGSENESGNDEEEHLRQRYVDPSYIHTWITLLRIPIPLPPPRNRKKITWDTIRNSESIATSSSATAVQENKKNHIATAIHLPESDHRNNTSGHSYRRRTPRVGGVKNLRFETSNSNKLNGNDSLLSKDKNREDKMEDGYSIIL